eukprot:gene18024-13971_t
MERGGSRTSIAEEDRAEINKVLLASLPGCTAASMDDNAPVYVAVTIQPTGKAAKGGAGPIPHILAVVEHSVVVLQTSPTTRLFEAGDETQTIGSGSSRGSFVAGFQPMQCSSDIDIKGVLNALARSASDGWGAELSQIMAVDIEYSSGLQPDMVAKPVPGALQTRGLPEVVRSIGARGSTVFHADDLGLLDFREAAPLITALHWNKHFNKLIVRDTRVHAAVLESLALLALRNTAIEVLVLSRVAAKTDFWIMFGMSLQGNSGISLLCATLEIAQLYRGEAFST